MYWPFCPSLSLGSSWGRLSQSGSQQKAFHAVRAFAQAMNKCLWTPRGFAGHTKLSIIQAVREKCLISIYVPGSRSEILDYLAVELQALNDQNTPYLLVTSGITLPNSPRFQSLFLQEHSAMNYATGILAEDLSSAVQTDASDRTQAALFGQLQELFVFALLQHPGRRPLLRRHRAYTTGRSPSGIWTSTENLFGSSPPTATAWRSERYSRRWSTQRS